MIIGERYTTEKATSGYDAVVIGSGIGGLATAATLAKAGQKVLVLERHYTAGGFTHTFTRKGYEWDVGVHYIGEAHKKDSLVRKMFDFITDGKLQWADMGQVYDRMISGDQTFDFEKGHKAFKKNLIERFPNDKAAIERYMDLVLQVKKSVPYMAASKMMPGWLEPLTRPVFALMSNDLHTKTTDQVLRELTDNAELRGVLATQWGDCGLTPTESSFTIHAVIAGHYMGGGAYPVGGSARIAQTILPVIKAAGGRVLIRAEVEEIMVRNGTALGVRMTNGDEIKAARVISAVGAPLTYGKFLDERHRNRYGIQKNMTKVQASGGHLCLYVGLKECTAQLGLEKPNLWVFPSLDHDANVAAYKKDMNQPFPLIYISFPSAKDPEWESRYPGRATLEVVTLSPYEWFEAWEQKRWMKRGEDYETLKTKLTQRLLEALYEQVPAVRGKVDHAELSTPLSTKHFCNYPNGEIYGLDHTPDRFSQKWLRPKTPIKNLYMAGQDVFMAGVTGALTGGLMTAGVILGPKMLTLLPEAGAKLPLVGKLIRA